MPHPDTPANYTPLAALPVAVLDLETTGLDVTRDRIVQIGVVCMQGATILDAPRLERLVDPGMPIPAESTWIHGIDDGRVRGAGTFVDHVGALREIIDGRVVAGHHSGFDLAVLRHEAARAGIDWIEPPSIDLAALAGALEPTLPDLNLEIIARWLGVEVTARHTAIGDCLTAARAFAVLFERLRIRGVRTLGELQGTCRRRPDLAEHGERAGWNTVPGEARAAATRASVRLDSQVYVKRLEDVMHGPPVTVDRQAPLRAAAASMVDKHIGSLLIVDDDDRPSGILTERDLLRASAAGTDALSQLAVGDAMTSPVEVMDSGEMLYRALGRMTRRAIRHLCVVDVDGRAVGMVSQRDLLGHRARAVSALGDAIEDAHDGPALAAIHGQLPAVAEALTDDGLGGIEVARVVSNEVRALTGRAAAITARRLGPAPAPWCVIVLGSAGRGESLLSADQDNALVHGGGGDDPWFAELGAGIAALLDEAGIPLCTGGVMASKPAWRGTQDAWRSRVDSWFSRAAPEDLLNVDIFFDMVPVAGDSSCAQDLRREAIAAASGSTPFIALLAESVSRLAPSLGLFGRLPVDNGRIDLKRHGLLPVVSMARVLALKVGSAARSTPERIEAAVAANRLTPGDARRLVAAHRELMTVVLEQQLADLEAGVKPSSRVEVARLDRDARGRLSGYLKDIAAIVEGVRGLVAGG